MSFEIITVGWKNKAKSTDGLCVKEKKNCNSSAVQSEVSSNPGAVYEKRKFFPIMPLSNKEDLVTSIKIVILDEPTPTDVASYRRESVPTVVDTTSSSPHNSRSLGDILSQRNPGTRSSYISTSRVPESFHFETPNVPPPPLEFHRQYLQHQQIQRLQEPQLEISSAPAFTQEDLSLLLQQLECDLEIQ